MLLYTFLGTSLVAFLLLYALLQVGARAERAARAAQQKREAYRRRLSRHHVSIQNSSMLQSRREARLGRWNGWYR